MAPNYSLHLIPVYWLLALLPHAYAVCEKTSVFLCTIMATDMVVGPHSKEFQWG